MANVFHHYQHTVWPLVKQLVITHPNGESSNGLVLEGSALWPAGYGDSFSINW